MAGVSNHCKTCQHELWDEETSKKHCGYCGAVWRELPSYDKPQKTVLEDIQIQAAIQTLLEKNLTRYQILTLLKMA